MKQFMRSRARPRRFPSQNSKVGCLTVGMINLGYLYRAKHSKLILYSRGGVGVDTSAAYIGPEFARIFYKINYGFRTAIQNLYMVS